MIEILWASLALGVLALSGAAVALILAVRDNVKKAGQSLDALNKELPGLLAAARHSAEDVESVLALGSTLSKGFAWVNGLLKGAQAFSGVFNKGKVSKEDAAKSE